MNDAAVAVWKHYIPEKVIDSNYNEQMNDAAVAVWKHKPGAGPGAPSDREQMNDAAVAVWKRHLFLLLNLLDQ